VSDRLAAPQALDHAQRLLEPADSPARVQSYRLVIGVAIAQADADDEPAAADHVERGELLGEVDRLVQRQQQHPGAERHPLRLGRHARQRRQRLEVRERLRQIVLTRPHRRQPHRPRQPHLLDMRREPHRLRLLHSMLHRQRHLYLHPAVSGFRRPLGALKTVQMLGGEEFPTEAWAAHAAGRERRANDADGPFSAPAASSSRSRP
jgi:hypothetical protein